MFSKYSSGYSVESEVELVSDEHQVQFGGQNSLSEKGCRLRERWRQWK